MRDLIERLDKVTRDLVNEWGTDSYRIRCELYDISEKLKTAAPTHEGVSKEAARQILNDFTPKVYEFLLKPPFNLEHAQHGIACENFADIRNEFISDL